MIVVADSGPLHYLILLDQTSLLHRFYGEVLLPDAVAVELRAARSPQQVQDWMARPPPWLQFMAAEEGLVDVHDVLARLSTTNFYADVALVRRIFGKWLAE